MSEPRGERANTHGRSGAVERALRGEIARIEGALAQGGFLLGEVQVLDEGSWGRLDAVLEGTEQSGKLQIHLNKKGVVRIVPQGSAAQGIARALGSVGIDCTTASHHAPTRTTERGAAEPSAKSAAAARVRALAIGVDGELVVDCSKFGRSLIGPTEWRGMLHQGGAWREVFHSPRFARGHNNLGEFLAIIDAVRRIERGEIACTALLSDSRTAISWFTKGRIRTAIPVNEACDPIFAREFSNAQQWLASCDRVHWSRLLSHWSVKIRGENPADFGRK